MITFVNMVPICMLRPYNGAMMTIGPAHLELPPGYTEIVDDGTYPTQCMEQMLKEIIYIAEIIPHMHYLGMCAGSVERNLIQNANV